MRVCVCVCVCVCLSVCWGERAGSQTQLTLGNRNHKMRPVLKHREALQPAGAWEAPDSTRGGRGGLPGGGGIPTKWKALARAGGGGGGCAFLCTCVYVCVEASGWQV